MAEETPEGQEQQEQQGGDDFASAFAEATGQAEPEEEPSPEGPEEDSGGEGEDEAGGEAGDETESEEAEEPAQAEPESAPSKLSYHELREKVENGQASQAELNDFVHRVKSWEGTLSAKDRQLQEYREQLEQLQASQGGGQEGEGEQGGDQQGGGAQQLQQFHQKLAYDFGEETAQQLTGYVEQRANEIAEQRVGQVAEERLAPIEQAIQEAQAAANEAEIREAHPDFGQLQSDLFVVDEQGTIQADNSGKPQIRSDSDLRSWVEEKPAYLQGGYWQALLEGTPDHVNDVLNRYKSERGLNKPDTQETEPAPKQQQKAKQATAVKGRGGGPPKGRAQDFDSAFAEAMQKRG